MMLSILDAGKLDKFNMKYSPFKVSPDASKAEWALTRLDDLLNWGRKVIHYFSNFFLICLYLHKF